MKWKLPFSISKISKVLLVGAMGFTCLQLNNLHVFADSNSLKDETAIKKALEIYFDEPVSQGTLKNAGASENEYWQQLSLPIGNSMMGANVYGEISKEHLTFNQKTLWNGGPSEKRPNYNGGNRETVDGLPMADYIKGIQDRYLKGELTDAEFRQLCNRIVGDNADAGYGAYQSFGDIYLDFKLNGTATNYRRNLDLNNAVANVDFTMNGTDYHREYFASYPDNVIAMKVTAKGTDKLNFNVTFPIDNATSAALGKTVSTNVKDGTITVKGSMNDNQMKLNGQLKVVTKDGALSPNGEGIDIKNATEAVIFVNAATDYKNEYPVYRTGESDDELNARVADVISTVSEKGYEEVKKTAIDDYTTIFDRMMINLGQDVPNLTTDALLTAYNNGQATDEQRRALETTLFQFGRYLQIASSREGDLPANLQGVWNNRVGTESQVPWASDYHMNVNLQMNYWPSYNTNMAECANPLVDYVDSLREPGRVTAETYFGVKSDENNPENGFTAHTQNTPFGWTCPGYDFSWGWSPAAVPWILQNVYESYEYTGDKEYLRDKIYPMLKEQAKLYQQILVEDPKTGRLVTVPAYSPEHGPATAGNTYEQTLAWQLFKDSIEAATALGIDEDLVAQWTEIQSKLKPIEIGTDGQIKEWYQETSLGSVPGTDRNHRHLSHILGLFPGDLISAENPEYFDAAEVSLTGRGDDATGWGMGQRLNSWARLGDGEHAYDIIKAFFNKGAYPNLWDAHPPFQIDGNFGYTAGVAEMLMQSNMGYINLLPALPESWSEGQVKGLVARGNFELNMDWKDMSMIRSEILSKNGGDCTIQYPNISKAVIKQDGKVVKTTVDSQDRITFATDKGATYTIEELPERPLRAPKIKAAFSGGSDTLINFAPVAFAASYDIYRSLDGEAYEKIDSTTSTQYHSNEFIEGAKYKVVSIREDGTIGVFGKDIDIRDLNKVDKIDDRDNLITYSSGWGDWSDAGQYNGTEKYTDTTGSSLEFYFSGVGLRVIGMKTGNTHKYDLYIDDELILKDVDTNSSTTKRQAVLSEIKGLKDGMHKARLYVSQAKISLDAFEFIRDVKPTGLNVTSESDTLNININKTMQMKASYSPTGAGDAEKVAWSVENDLGYPSNIASISDDGVLTATKPGTVIVKAIDEAHNYQAEKTITVKNEAAATKYDDRDTSITYGSGWSPWDEGKHEFGTITEAMTKGANFTFDFTGTGVSLYFMKLEAAGGSAGANIEVFIDGESAGTYSTFTTVTGSQPKQKIFEKQGLENKKHNVKVVVGDAGAGAPTGSNPKVSFDYYEITSGGSVTLDYRTLKEEMQTFMDMDLSSYTEATRVAYEEAFEQAKALYEAADNQDAITNMVNTLIEKRNGLQASENENFLKEMLGNTIEKAGKVTSEDLDKLAPAVKTAFVKALGEAKLVYNNDEATVDQIVKAWLNLANSMHYLDFKADKTALHALIEKYKDLNTDDYTIGVEEFKAALEEAMNVAADENALQTRIDAASGRLIAAVAGLDSQDVNKAALRILIGYADEAIKNIALYDQGETWNTFMSTYDEAVVIANNASATQSEINAVVAKLASAYENIRLLPNEELLGKLKSFIEVANALNPKEYSTNNYAFVMQVRNESDALLNSDSLTQNEIIGIYAQIDKAMEIINDGKLQGSEVPGDVLNPTEPGDVQQPVEDQSKVNTPMEETKSANKANGTTKPSTGDTTTVNTIAITTLVAGACMLVLRKRKN